MCVSATLNGSVVEYILSSTGKQKLGWMAMGFGQQMANSPMVILWPNSDGSITLSQRSARSEVMPTVDNNPPRVASVSTSLSSTSGQNPRLAFTIPADTNTKPSIIYGYSTTSPSSSAPNAVLVQHLESGVLRLDLTKPLSPSSTAPGATPTGGSADDSLPGSSDSLPLLPYQRLIVAHAILVVLGFLLFLPAGALLARYLRTFSPTWFQGHWIFQFAISGPLIVAGVALGIQSVSTAGAPHLDDAHKKWGVAIFVLYVIQCGLGAVIHWVKPKDSRRRPPQNYIHAVLGLTVIGLALYQVRSGYKTEWPKATGRGDVPNGANIIWHVWVIMIPVLYTLGLFLLPKQLRQEKKSRAARRRSN
ncbi:CBD9-like protein [Infundibulicybe gibba]|nr:CBD9-like protein [Infundibulicybe gibba]